MKRVDEFVLVRRGGIAEIHHPLDHVAVIDQENADQPRHIGVGEPDAAAGFDLNGGCRALNRHARL